MFSYEDVVLGKAGVPGFAAVEAGRGLAEALAEALDARDRYTAGHSLRVADYAYGIARELELGERHTENIRVAAWLHDIGKIGIPDAILLKPGALTAEEFGLVKLHPQIGRRILERAPGFEALLDAVELHHENYDGSGYPYGLAGENIHFDARLIRVADAFDAMTTHRSYRPAHTAEAAMAEIHRGSGREFDPRCALALLRILGRAGRGELRRVAGCDLIPAPPAVIERLIA
jgi:HD-GYP domain-containing protein (c-di-GMP phosphodiesterase class II)